MEALLEANEMKEEVYVAIVKGNLDLLKEQSDETLLKKTNGNNNGIHIAIRHESSQVLEMLLKRFHKNKLIWEQNSQGDTPLHIAAKIGDSSIVQLLYKHLENLPSSPNPWRLKNSEGNTPVHVAIINQNLNIAKFLLAKDIYLARVVNNATETLLHLAITHFRDVDECKSVKARIERLVGQERAYSVIEANADLKSLTMIEHILKAENCVALLRDVNGSTPLHKAAMLDQLHIGGVIRLILKHCPQSALVYDASGNSILHLGIGRKLGFLKLMHLLDFKEVYASRGHQNKEGNTPLHIAIVNKDIHMVRALLSKSFPKLTLKNKAGISIASLFEQDILHERRDMTLNESNAANEGNVPYFNTRMEWTEYELLLAKDSCGRNILHKLMKMENESHTVHQDFVNLIQKVLESPHELARQTDLKGDTPVHVLVRNRHDSTLGRSGFLPKLLDLYKEVAPWLAKNELGNTPLHEAIIANNTQVVGELLEFYDKSTNDNTPSVWLVLNVQGNTPLHLALIFAKDDITLMRKLLDLYKKHVPDKASWLLKKNVQGNTPIHEALIAKNPTFVRELLEYDLKAAAMVNGCGESPLHLIVKSLVDCEQIDDEDLKSLIEAYKVATTWSNNKDGQTMWHMFVLDFPLALTRRLTNIYKNHMDFKNLTRIKNNDQNTPLHLAIHHQKFDHANLLIKFFPQVLKETDKEGKTPLHLLLLNNNRHVELIEQCLKLTETKKMVKELLYMPDNKRITPFHLVIHSGDFGLVKQCLDIAHEVKMGTHLLNDQDREKNTLLHLAIEGQHFGFVYDLLHFAMEQNMDVDNILETKNKYGNKPSDLIGAISDLPPELEQLFLKESKFRGIRSVYGITKPQINDYVNTMGVIAALLATITFTAAFTVPGGLVGDKGTPMFIREASFQFFMLFNVLTMCLSIMVLFCLLWIKATGDHRKSMMLTDFSMSLLQISFYTILLAFMGGVYATIEPVKPWVAICTLVLCSLTMLIMRKSYMVKYIGPFGTDVLVFVSKYFPDVVEIVGLCTKKRQNQQAPQQNEPTADGQAHLSYQPEPVQDGQDTV